MVMPAERPYFEDELPQKVSWMDLDVQGHRLSKVYTISTPSRARRPVNPNFGRQHLNWREAKLVSAL